jgi:hypothetical protein
MAEAMPDFARLVKLRMGRYAATAGDDVVCELAGHLEDLYGELLSKGLTPAEAEREALAWAGDWKRLERGIEDAREGKMMERMPKILLPGAVALFVSVWGQKQLWRMGWSPTMTSHYYRGLVEYHGWGGMPLHWADAPWLLVLVVSGALGAWLCRLMGGNWRQRIWAAELPTLCTLVLLAVLIFIGLPIEYFHGSLAPARELVVAWLSFMLTNMLLPGVALLVGALLVELLPTLTRRAGGRLSRA